MIRAFELAVRQLGDPKLRGIIWWSLLLSLVPVSYTHLTLPTNREV